jgi:hypothetical protein
MVISKKLPGVKSKTENRKLKNPKSKIQIPK